MDSKRVIPERGARDRKNEKAIRRARRRRRDMHLTEAERRIGGIEQKPDKKGFWVPVQNVVKKFHISI